MKKIVLKVTMHCDKSRSKAMKIAAAVQGVNSVALGGESRDQVVVTGDGVDSFCLAKRLRKKFRYADILSAEEVNTESPKPPANGSESNDYSQFHCQYQCPPPFYYEVVYDPNPQVCPIL